MKKLYYGLIYKITNLINNKCYLGQTTNFKNRKNGHIQEFRRKIHCNKYFQNSWNKYKEHNFKFEIIGYCYSREELNKSEIACIEFFQSNNPIYGYNIAMGGLSGNIFNNHPDKEKIRKKLSRISKNRKWIHKGEVNKLVKEKKLNIYLLDGWQLGRFWEHPFKGKTWDDFFGEEKNKEIQAKRSKALKGRSVWSKGLTKETDDRIKKLSKISGDANKNTIWIKKDKKSIKVKSEILQKFLDDDWTMGRLFKDSKIFTMDEINLLISLYTKESWTIREIENYFNTTKFNIVNILKDNNIKLRNKKETSKIIWKKRNEKYGLNSNDIKLLIKLYLDDLWSFIQLSKYFGIYKGTVKNILIKNNIKLRNKNENTKLVWVNKKSSLDKNNDGLVVKLYVQYFWALKQIMNFFDITMYDVKHILKENNIQLRNIYESAKIRINREEIINKCVA